MPTTIAPRIDLGVDQWVVLPATWEIYTGLSAARGEKSRPRYIFVDGRLTVVSPGCPHESVKTRIGGMIEEMLTSLRIPFKGLGSVTLLTARFPRTGVEADETYFLSDIARVHRKRDLVVGEDPAPDLVVEVVISHPSHDSLEAYRRFGVKEVWLVTETGIEFLVASPEGAFAPSPFSGLLPFLNSEEITPWALREDPEGDVEARIQFRAWVTETLVPRV